MQLWQEGRQAMSDSSHSSGVNWAHIFEEYWVFMLFGTLFLMTMFFPVLLMGLAEKVPPVLLYGGVGTVFAAIVGILGYGLMKAYCKKGKA
jgi:hypothetical protein